LDKFNDELIREQIKNKQKEDTNETKQWRIQRSKFMFKEI
jgi:hypothetical protein